MHLRPNEYKASINRDSIKSRQRHLKFPLKSDLSSDLRNDLKSYLQTELYSDFDYDSLCLEFSRHFYGASECKSSNTQRSKTYVNIRDLVGIRKTKTHGRSHTNSPTSKSKTSSIRSEDLRFTKPVLDTLDLDSFFDRSPLLENENLSHISGKVPYDSLRKLRKSENSPDLTNFLEKSALLGKSNLHTVRRKSSHGSLRSNREVKILATVEEIYCHHPSCMDGFGKPVKFFKTWDELASHNNRRHMLDPDSNTYAYWKNLQRPRIPQTVTVRQTENVQELSSQPQDNDRHVEQPPLHPPGATLPKYNLLQRSVADQRAGANSIRSVSFAERNISRESVPISCYTLEEDTGLTRVASYAPSESMSLGEISFMMDVDASHAVALEDNSKLAPLRQPIVQELVSNFLATFRTRGSGAGGTPYSVSNNSNLSVATTGTVGTTATSLSAHSMSYRKRQSPDDDDEDESRRIHHRRLSDQILSPSTTKLLACPYAKFNPCRYSERNSQEKNYRGCSSSFLRDIARVKQHLYRVHMRPAHHCFRCYATLPSSTELELHLRNATCPIMSVCPFDEKMTVDQVTAIRRREMGKGAEGAWYDIYKILFPAANLPVTPYAETEAPEVVDGFLDYFRREGPTRIAGMAGPMLFGTEWTEDLQDFTSQVLESCIELVVRGYREGEK